MSTRRTQHFFSLPFLFLLALLSGACGDNIEPDDGVEALTISQPSATVSVGMTLTVRLDARFDDGTTRDVSTEATWTTSNVAVASVSGPAITAEGEGTATITAAYGERTATVVITVNAATLTAIQVTPGSAVTALGLTQQFTATGTFSDGTSRDITAQVTWAAMPGTVATIDPAGVATPVSVGTATITASSVGITAMATLRISAASLVSIEVAPADETADQTIDVGATLALAATGVLSDGTTQDLTRQVTWTTSDAAIATVTDEDLGSNGLVTAVAAGTVTITASLGDVGTISGSTTVVVNDPNAVTLVSIAVTAAGDVMTLPLGLTAQLTATGTYSDSTTADLTAEVEWASSNGNITVSNEDGSEGLALAVTLGTAELTATLGAVTSSPVFVLEATPALIEDFALEAFATTVAVGEPLLVVAVGQLSDETSAPVNERLTWTSSDPAIASVSDAAGSKGVVTGVAEGGPVTITATDGTITKMFEVTLVTAARAKLIINEVDYDQINPDDAEFIEIVNAGGLEADLTGHRLVLVNGNNNQSYGTPWDLAPLTTLAPGQVLVVGVDTVLDTLPAEVPGDPTSIKRILFEAPDAGLIQNGAPDGILLVSGSGAGCVVVDSLSYEGAITAATVAGCDGTINLVEGDTASTVADSNSVVGSLTRTHRIDTDRAHLDWTFTTTLTPGL